MTYEMVIPRNGRLDHESEQPEGEDPIRIDATLNCEDVLVASAPDEGRGAISDIGSTPLRAVASARDEGRSITSDTRSTPRHDRGSQNGTDTAPRSVSGTPIKLDVSREGKRERGPLFPGARKKLVKGSDLGRK